MTDERSFVELLGRAARADADRVFALFDGAPITFGTLDRRSDALALSLRGLGVAPEERVAVMMRNGPSALATVFGLGKAGIVWVPINAGLRGDGLRFILTHAQPRAVIADADLAGAIRACGAAPGASLLVHGAVPGPNRLEPLLDAEALFPESPPTDQAAFAISYTSGTTGPWIMREMLGLARTIDLTLSGRLMDAAECHAVGLINRIVAPEDVLPTALALARELAAKPPVAMRLNRRRFREMTQDGFRDCLDAGIRTQREAFASHEPAEMMKRFLAKRSSGKPS